MQEFKGKTAVITGGASGIGFGMAEVFAEEQMNIVLADIEASALEEAVARLESRQVSVRGVVTDTMRRSRLPTRWPRPPPRSAMCICCATTLALRVAKV